MGTARWTSVAIGSTTSCAIAQADASLSCWGANESGQAGAGSTAGAILVPTLVAAGPARWKTVGVGDSHACAVGEDHSLWCWGSNSSGQLGVGTGPSRTAPVAVAPALGKVWTAVASGYAHTCAVRDDGTLWCWGSNDQDGLGKAGAWSATPQQVDATATWSSVAAGTSSGCALRTDGSLYCWGSPATLGANDLSLQPADHPTRVSVNPCTMEMSTCGPGSICLADAAQNVRCDTCKPGFSGPLCASDVDECATPANVCAPAHAACSNPIAGNFSCQCDAGYAGDGTFCTVPYTHIAIGDNDHACAIDAAGKLHCWGNNGGGQLGTGPVVTGAVRAVPVGTATWRAIATGSDFSCGIQTGAGGADGGTLWCWGNGSVGQAGQGVRGFYPTPTQVGARSDWIALTLGIAHGCAIDTGFNLWCWGVWNGSNGGVTPTPTPVSPAPAGSWTKVSAGGQTTLALRGSSLYCWGVSSSGQCGSYGNDTYGNQAVYVDHPPVDRRAERLGRRQRRAGPRLRRRHGRHALVLGRERPGAARHPHPRRGGDHEDAASGRHRHRLGQRLGGHRQHLRAQDRPQPVVLGRRDSARRREHARRARSVQVGYVTGSARPARDGVIATDWLEVASGNDSVCARRADGTAWCWGTPYALGNGTMEGSIIPYPVYPCVAGDPGCTP